MGADVQRAREYFGEKPEDSFAWQEVNRVCIKRGGPPLDPKSDDDLVWALDFISSAYGVEG